MRAHIVISGFGAISALGSNVDETLAGFTAGRRRVRSSDFLDTSIANPVFAAADLPDADSGTMRSLQLALQAAREALAAARIEPPCSERRIGVCLGTTVACQLNDIDFLVSFRETGRAPMQPVDRFLKGNLAEAVARKLDLDGPSVTVANACSSGSDAIGTAFSWLKHDLCDIVVAGGADELNRVPVAGFHSLGIMSPELCRPFDENRRGLNLGEGAGILVLETEASARERNIRSGLRLAGFGAAGDAYHMTTPRPDGASLEKSIRSAMDEAEVSAAEIAFVNAHGTATRENDRIEGQVLSRVLGDDAVALSTKGYTGHTLGAAGGLEAVFAALALREAWIPACAGFGRQDAEIPLAPVRARTAVNGDYALSTSLAFGGSNAAIVIGRLPADDEDETGPESI